MYGHYDVQPADPLELWHSGPFEPVIRDGKIYARGACDDKGQMFTHLKAAEGWLKAVGRLPHAIEIEARDVARIAWLDQQANAGAAQFFRRETQVA